MFLSSTHYLVSPRSCSFLAYPFNRSVVFSFQVLSSYQALLLFSIGVQPEFFLSHLVSTGVVTFSSLSLEILIHVFATSKVLIVFLVPLFHNGVFSPSFVFVVFFLSSCSTSRGSLVSFVVQEAT